MIKRKLVWFACMFVLFGGLAGCTKPVIKPTSETEGVVVVTPSPAMSAGTEYYFYSTLDGGSRFFNAGADGGLSGTLLAGTYRMLAVEADVQGVEFRGMNKFETASVYLKAGETQISEVYILSLDEVVVEEGETTTQHVEPVVLTSTFMLNLDLSGFPSEVTAVSGSLNGFYPGMILSSQEPVAKGAATTVISFEATGGSTRATLFVATVRSFGFHNPKPEGSGTPLYTSELQLTLTFADGSSQTVTKDLTEYIAAMLLSGAAPTIDVSIAVNPAAGAEGWKDGNNLDGSLK
jgi:hypothetical protein